MRRAEGKQLVLPVPSQYGVETTAGLRRSRRRTTSSQPEAMTTRWMAETNEEPSANDVASVAPGLFCPEKDECPWRLPSATRPSTPVRAHSLEIQIAHSAEDTTSELSYPHGYRLQLYLVSTTAKFPVDIPRLQPQQHIIERTLLC